MKKRISNEENEFQMKKTNFKLRKRISNEENEFHHHQTKQKAPKVKKIIKFSQNDKKKKNALCYNTPNTFQCKCILVNV
ncbi:hypothetical protein [Helicobacter pylori]|uniref:hypothetical protein n=1 Tax=Helicobacter pylori TaxID=210 RepID=UPI00160372C7|nr:hypothetical protein [Helicobacter pylori]